MLLRSLGKKREAFTLVELLVVIGIIALLIGILLPSLNRARQSAKDVACLANLRSIGQGFGLYAVDNKDWWPKPGGQLFINGVQQPAGTAGRDVWTRALFRVLYKRQPDPNGTDTRYTYLVNTVFECPSARGRWDGNAATDLSYGMSTQLNASRNGAAGTGGRNNYKRVVKVKRASETMVVMDTNMPWAGVAVNPASTVANAEPWQKTWNDQLLQVQKALPRHRDRVNVLYVDGHADPVLYVDLPRADPVNSDLSSPECFRFWTGTE